MKFRVYRYNPDTDRKPYMQAFEVQAELQFQQGRHLAADLAGQHHRDVGHGNRVFVDPGLVAYGLAGGESVLEQTVEDLAQGAQGGQLPSAALLGQRGRRDYHGRSS